MVQIVEQTHDEKVEMYKKCTKLELIEMLISCNLHLEAVTKQLHKPDVMGRSELLIDFCGWLTKQKKTTLDQNTDKVVMLYLKSINAQMFKQWPD